MSRVHGHLRLTSCVPASETASVSACEGVEVKSSTDLAEAKSKEAGGTASLSVSLSAGLFGSGVRVRERLSLASSSVAGCACLSEGSLRPGGADAERFELYCCKRLRPDLELRSPVLDESSAANLANLLELPPLRTELLP